MALDGLTLFFPCHNEEANVEKLLQDALRIAPLVASRFEIIIVDDGSTDQTAAIAARFPGVRLVRHDRCKGYGEALKSGFQAAKCPWIFFSDGDRQFDLEEMPRLTSLADQADIVSGYRVERADPGYRLLNSKIYGFATQSLFGLDIPDINCAFKLYRRMVFDRITLGCSGALINAEIFAKAQKQGFRIATVGVTHRPRTAGRPTGADPKVIFKAMKELISLWWELRTTYVKN